MDKPNGGSTLLQRLAASKSGASGIAKDVAASMGAKVSTQDRELTDSTVKQQPAVKPIKTSDKQVLFKAIRANLGSVTPNNKAFKFRDGWLLTDEEEVIAYIRENAEHFNVKEEK